MKNTLAEKKVHHASALKMKRRRIPIPIEQWQIKATAVEISNDKIWTDLPTQNKVDDLNHLVSKTFWRGLSFKGNISITK